MINLSTKKDKPLSIDERVFVLKSNIDKGGIYLDYDRLLERYAFVKAHQERILKLFSEEAGVYNFTLNSLNDLQKHFIKTNMIKGFNVTKKGNLSFNEESVKNFILTGAYGEKGTKLATLMSEYSTLETSIAQFDFILTNGIKVSTLSTNGTRLILLKPDVAPQNTGRLGLIKPGFMNLPRAMKDLRACPRGWVLIQCDSSQIEPKITNQGFLQDPQINHLISINGDAYYGLLQYCTMDYELIRSGTLDLQPLEKTDELKELRTKIKTYGNAVVYGSTSNIDNDPIKDAYIKRIGQHPKMIAWRNSLSNKIATGQREFETMFGTPIDIYKSDKVLSAKNDNEKQVALLHCAINNPIQGTAADCMAFSLEYSHRLIQEKAPNSWIGFYIHDEGGFYVHESEWDKVGEDLMGATAYNIDDGKIVIYNEPKIDSYVANDFPTFRCMH